MFGIALLVVLIATAVSEGSSAQGWTQRIAATVAALGVAALSVRVSRVTTENAAHRIAVEWDDKDATRAGMVIPRRDSDSRLTVLLDGRIFPGAHSYARFAVEETEERLRVAFRSANGAAEVDVRPLLSRRC